MNLLLTNNKVDNLDELNNLKKSNLFSSDRYYTWLNSQIDLRLRYTNKLSYLLISFLMRSNHFRHNTNNIIKKPFWLLLIDIIGWLSMIAFVICLITGVATPIISAVNATINIGKDNTTITTVAEAWQQAFGNGQTIVALVFTVITLIIGSIYLYALTKVIPKNKSLSIKDYVSKKIDYMVKFNIFVKTEQQINHSLEKAKQKLKIKDQIINNIVFEKAEILNDADRWQILQINNIIFKMFTNFNIILKFENVDENYIKAIQEIVAIDFENINLIAK